MNKEKIIEVVYVLSFVATAVGMACFISLLVRRFI